MTDSPSPVHVLLGATGGIGSALAQRLSDSGARLVVAGRDASRVQALADRLGATPSVFDARERGAVDACVKSAVEQHGRVDGLACCIGSMLLKPAHLTTDAEWEETMSLNLGVAFATVRAAGRHLRQGGSVVLFSSAAARTGLSNHEAIAAAKAGIVGLTLSAAATYASRGLRVNCVAPGLVRTGLSARITGNEKALAASTAMHPLGRIGEPEEVAGAAAWLLDAEQSWVTGQTLGVDGGLGTLRPR